MQRSNALESYINNDEHIYDSICDVNQKKFLIHSTNTNTYRVLSTSFTMNDLHEQKSEILSHDSIENSWQKYWEWWFSLTFI